MRYADVGVHRARASRFIRFLKGVVPRRRDVLAGVGAFSGVMLWPRSSTALAATCDGVGTKLLVACRLGGHAHETIGWDAVAMNVNDLVAEGARPLGFLDYLAMGRLSNSLARTIARGAAAACRASSTAFLGGETAEMPGLYRRDEYDLAGFAVGATGVRGPITGREIRPGDVLIGLPSNGLHSNGYSLVRRIIPPAELARRRREFFRRTRLYVRPVLDLLSRMRPTGLAHITGGGVVENLERILPPGCRVEMDAARWHVPPLFRELARRGRVPMQEMVRVFNLGIGFVVVVREKDAKRAMRVLRGTGGQEVEDSPGRAAPTRIGVVTRGGRGVTVDI